MVKKVTSFVNHKGGVGKTAIATNLACTLSSMEYKTLLVDLDPQGHSCITFCLEIDENNTISNVIKDRGYDIRKSIKPAIVSGSICDNLFIIPSDLELSLTEVEIYGRTRFETLLSRQLKKIVENYDYILIDCPPNLGPLTQNAIFASGELLIPTNYDKFSLRGVRDLLKKVYEVKDEQEDFTFYVVRNRKDPRDKKIIQDIESEIQQHLPVEQIFDTVIRKASVLEQARSDLEPIAVYSPKSSINNDFEELAKEYIGK